VSPSLLIEKLESLLPEIKRTGDPSGVLLKFATDENLAPAQLEKMAHQYNTAKTLAYMKKAANRGGSFALVDTEELLGNYTQQESKSASVERISDWIDAPSSGISPSRFPDIELLEMSQALKAAAVTPAAPEMTEAEKYANDLAARRNGETLLQVRDDHNAMAWEAFDKFATTLHEREIPFAEVEDDMLCIMGKKATLVLPALTFFMEKAGRHIDRMEKPALRKLARDRHGVLPILNEAWEALNIVEGINGLLKAAGPGATADVDQDQDYDRELEKVQAAAAAELMEQERARGSSATPTEPEPKGDPNLGSTNSRPGVSSSTPPPLDPTENSRDSSGTKKKPKSRDGDDKSPKGDGGASGGDGPRGDGKELEPLKGELGKGWDSYLDWGKKLRPLQDPLKGVQDMVGLAQPGSNKRQEKIDTAHDDAAFQTGVERLIHTDPILSEADPAMVTDLANSIRSTNPQAALDLNYLKFTLREAIQYGALPHHTTKDLLTMRKELAQAQDAEGKNSQRLYGGAEAKV
jgi:hypothetical protein